MLSADLTGFFIFYLSAACGMHFRPSSFAEETAFPLITCLLRMHINAVITFLLECLHSEMHQSNLGLYRSTAYSLTPPPSCQSPYNKTTVDFSHLFVNIYLLLFYMCTDKLQTTEYTESVRVK